MGRRVRRRAGLRLAALLGSVAAACTAAGSPAPPPRPAIVTGALTSGFPSTAALLLGSDPDTASSWCTGVLIGCQTLLTAAHCVCEKDGPGCQGAGAPRPDGRIVYLQHAGFARVASIRVHPAFSFPVADVAIVRLAAPVTGIAPSRIVDERPPHGTPGIIVGFGRGGGYVSDYGLKRWGTVTTGPCARGISDETSVCWSYDGTGANTCNGDSGGPLFVDPGQGLVVAGVTSGGRRITCLPDDFDYDASIWRYRAWILAQAGPDLGRASCGGLPAAGESGTAVVRFTGTLDGARPTASHRFDVPAGTNELRVALQGVDDGEADFDLYVKAGSPATATSWDCRAIGSSQYSFCGFDFPAAGPWYALAQRRTGGGTYQLTATVFGGDPPVCGNGVRETGEECDGDDAPTCPGGCRSDCRCASVCAGANVLPVKVRLGRRFMVKAVVLGDAPFPAPDPTASGLSVALDDGVEPVRLTIAPGDDRWRIPASPDGTYEWRGRTAGGDPVVVRCRRLRSGGWHVAARGRGVSRRAPARPAAGTRR
jgi:hypothetical protein